MYFSTTIAVIIIAILFLVWCLSRVLSDKTIKKDKISDFFYYFALAIKRIGEYVVVVATADFLCNMIAKKNIYHFTIVIAVWILSNFIGCRKCLFMGVSRIL